MEKFQGTSQLKGTQLLDLKMIAVYACIPYKSCVSHNINITVLCLSCLRSYPPGFGRRLCALHDKFKKRALRFELRQKAKVPFGATDVEIFQSLQTMDPWTDAHMPSLFIYLYKNEKLRIPESWEPTMSLFFGEMKRLVT